MNSPQIVCGWGFAYDAPQTAYRLRTGKPFNYARPVYTQKESNIHRPPLWPRVSGLCPSLALALSSFYTVYCFIICLCVEFLNKWMNEWMDALANTAIAQKSHVAQNSLLTIAMYEFAYVLPMHTVWYTVSHKWRWMTFLVIVSHCTVWVKIKHPHTLFVITLALHSEVNCGKSCYLICHLTITLLPHYLAKFKCSAVKLYRIVIQLKSDVRSFINSKYLQMYIIFSIMCLYHLIYNITASAQNICRLHTTYACFEVVHAFCRWMRSFALCCSMLCQAFSRRGCNLLCWRYVKWHQRHPEKAVKLK